jgi:hypothetical protein
MIMTVIGIVYLKEAGISPKLDFWKPAFTERIKTKMNAPVTANAQ